MSGGKSSVLIFALILHKLFAAGDENPLVLRTPATSCRCYPLRLRARAAAPGGPSGSAVYPAVFWMDLPASVEKPLVLRTPDEESGAWNAPCRAKFLNYRAILQNIPRIPFSSFQ